MNHRSRVVFLLLSFAVVLPLIAGGFVAASEEAKADAGRDSLYKYLTVFTEVFGLARRAYVDEPPSTQLMDGALAGAAEALDPFSFYLPADAVAPYLALHEDANRSVRRSGLRVLKDRGVAYAFAVLPDGPADDAGLMRGDVLAMIDGRSTRDMALWEIESTLAGAVDETVEIERIRLGEQRSVTITFRDTPLPGVTLEARDGLPVLRFDGFHAGTVDNVATSLRTLDAGTLPEIDPALGDRLVLDLRGVSGEDSSAAYPVAAFFADGDLGSLVQRDQDAPLARYRSDDPPADAAAAAAASDRADAAANDNVRPRFAGRLVVLVDRGTQGPAEVLATVLRQRADATLVGEQTFGHAGRQTLIALSNGGRLLLTDAFYAGPDGTPLHEPLEPDERVRIFDQLQLGDDDTVDPVLDRAIELLRDDASAGDALDRAA